MHPYLKQIGPCYEMSEQIERVLVQRLIELPETRCFMNALGPVYGRQAFRADRSMYWGIAGSLNPRSYPGQESLFAYFYIHFYKRNSSIVQLAYSPVRDKWGSDVTLKELKTFQEIIDSQDTDPDRLAREIRAGNFSDTQFAQELETSQVIRIVSLLVKWLIDMEEPRFSKTLISTSRRFTP